MKSMVKTIKQFNWRLWLVLAVTLFVPALYQTLRIFFLFVPPFPYCRILCGVFVLFDAARREKFPHLRNLRSDGKISISQFA